jgi:hypothetical protein
MILKTRYARCYTDDEQLPEQNRLLWLASESYAGWLLIDFAYMVDDGRAVLDLDRSEVIDGTVFLDGIEAPRSSWFRGELFDSWKKNERNVKFAQAAVEEDWRRCDELMRRKRA